MTQLDTDTIKKILVKQLFGDSSESEKQIFAAWLNQSEANRKLFEKLSTAKFIGQAIENNEVKIKQEVWQRIKWQTLQRRRRVIYRRVARVAAVVIICLGGVLLYTRQRNLPDHLVSNPQEILPGKSRAVLELPDGHQIALNQDTVFRLKSMGVLLMNRKDTLDIVGEVRPMAEPHQMEYHTIRIPRGGEYVARLSDGTTVHLNAESELRLPTVFHAESREVYFSGEAYFSVAQDTNRPFIVHAGGNDITVLGTEFGLRSYHSEEETITTLVKGRVAVACAANRCYLSPNEQARVNKQGNISVEQVNVYRYVAWTAGRIVFENERLEDIMNELARWYDFTIFFSNHKLKDLRFTVDIKKYSELKEFTALMEKMEKVFFKIKNRTVIVEEQKRE